MGEPTARIIAAVGAYLDANAAIPVLWSAGQGVPDATYVRAAVVPVAAVAVGVANCDKYIGIIALDVVGQTGIGDYALALAAGAIADLLPRGAEFAIGGTTQKVRVEAPGALSGILKSDDGRRYSPVRVNYSVIL